ncbi:hypothetical protein AB0K51_21630 [Kitasatospora sp. NPDC049285]
MALAERCHLAVWSTAADGRAGFPQDHRLFHSPVVIDVPVAPTPPVLR